MTHAPVKATVVLVLVLHYGIYHTICACHAVYIHLYEQMISY